MEKISDAMVIKGYFDPSMKSGDFIAEYKALTAEDKTTLAEGIRNGSLTY